MLTLWATILLKRFVELWVLDKPSGENPSSRYFPNNFRGFILGGEAMRVTVVASAHNGRSEPLVVEVSWDGTWSADLEEMRRHLVIKEM